MKRIEILAMLLLLCSFSAISIEGQQELNKVESGYNQRQSIPLRHG